MEFSSKSFLISFIFLIFFLSLVSASFGYNNRDIVTIRTAAFNDLTDVNIQSPSNSQVAAWNSTTLKWEAATLSGSGDITGVTAGTGLTGGGSSGDVTLNVNGTTCSAGEVSKYDGNQFTCVTDQDSGGGNPFNQVLNTTSNVTFFNATMQNIISNIIYPTLFKTIANGLFWNMYDDGSDLILNVTNGGGDFIIEQDNSKIKLFNSPLAANNFKVFQVFSKEASDVTEFVVTKAGDSHASYFIRSLAIAGNATNNPIPFNCSTYASFIDCATDITGADLWVEDDIEFQGLIYGNGSQLTNVPASEVLWNANYSTFLTHIDWSEATNGTLLTLAEVLAFSYYNATDFDINDYMLVTNSTLAGNYSATVDFCVAGGNCLSAVVSGSGISWAQATNGTLAEMSDVLAFSYYNVTDFDITDYRTFAQINTTIGYYNDTMKSYVDATASGISWATATNGTLTELTTVLGFDYYNLTDFNIDDYMLVTNSTLAGNYSATVDFCISGGACLSGVSVGGGITWAQATNGTLVELTTLLGFSYYNSTDFSIADYSLTSTILGFSYYNITDFDITDYATFSTTNSSIGYYNSTMKSYVDATASGITWAQATNGTLAELSTVLGFSYYNATDFDITDYSTLAEILAFNYYNSTDFDINDYMLVTNSTLAGNYSATVDFCIAGGNCLSAVSGASGITWAQAVNGTLYLSSNPSGYYNITSFDIADYATFAITNSSIGYYNDTMKSYVDAQDTTFNNSMKSYVDATASGITWAQAVNGTLTELATLLSFSYYNVTDFDINDYPTLSVLLGFNYYNATDFDITDYYTKAEVTTNITSANTTMKNYVDAVATGITWATAVNGTLAEMSDVLGFDYYNVTDFDIDDYLLNSNNSLAGNYSATVDFCISGGNCLSGVSVGGGITWAQATNGTLAELSTVLGFSYYNSTDFSIADYSLTSTIVGWGHYNSTDFDITDYATFAITNSSIGYYNDTMKSYVDAVATGITWAQATNGTLAELSTVLGFSYYNATDFDITDYSTTAEILVWSYYNATDFDINDYMLVANSTLAGNYSATVDFCIAGGNCLSAVTGGGGITWAIATNGTLAEMSDVLVFSYYNATDFDITDYYTKAEVTTNITSTNTTMKNYVDAQDTTFNNSMKSYVDNVAADTQKGTDGNYLYNDSTTIFFNDTRLNLTIDDRDTDTNETTRFNTLVGNCSAGQQVFGVHDDGTRVCVTDADSGPANIFDQILNTTSNVSFNNLTVTQFISATTFLGSIDWTNVVNKFIESVSGNFLNMVGTDLTFNETYLNLTIDIYNVSMKSYVDANAGIDSWAGNFTDYSNTATILGWNYYNVTDFDINDYPTLSVLLGFNYYNATDFDITDYATFSTTNSSIGYYNSTMKSYVDATASGITWANVVNGTTLLASQESTLNVNQSGWWDSLNTPSDINAADITDDNTYVTTTGDTMTGNLNMSVNNITTVDCIFFQNGGQICQT